MFINRAERNSNQVSVEKLKKRSSSSSETFNDTLESVFGPDAVNVDYPSKRDQQTPQKRNDQKADSDSEAKPNPDGKIDITA